MARQVKCPACGTMNDKENTKAISNKYYCIECGDIREKKIEKNKDGWDELFDYVCELYNIKTLTGIMFKQVKDYRNINNYTNKGMLLTLKYYYETLENEVKEDTGLGIVTYFYEEAKKHYIEKLNVKKYMKEFELKEEVKTIVINSNNIVNSKNNYNKNQLSFDTSTWEEESMDD